MIDATATDQKIQNDAELDQATELVNSLVKLGFANLSKEKDELLEYWTKQIYEYEKIHYPLD